MGVDEGVPGTTGFPGQYGYGKAIDEYERPEPEPYVPAEGVRSNKVSGRSIDRAGTDLTDSQAEARWTPPESVTDGMNELNDGHTFTV